MGWQKPVIEGILTRYRSFVKAKWVQKSPSVNRGLCGDIERGRLFVETVTKCAEEVANNEPDEGASCKGGIKADF